MISGVSVIICCYNSGQKLLPTLAHLARQAVLTGIDYEVVLVDNRCTDNTVALAEAQWAALHHPFSFRVIPEKKPGLNHARKTGIVHARYEYVVFCDDDNWLCPDYLTNVFQLFEVHKDVAVLGGVGFPVFGSGPPEWFARLQGFGYAVGSEGRKTGYVEQVYGAGMAMRRSLFLTIAGTTSFVLTDRRGNSLVSGGDAEICILVRRAGYRIYLDEKLSFHHFLPADRLTWSYYLRLRRSFGRATAALEASGDLADAGVGTVAHSRIRQTFSLLKYCSRNWRYLFFFLLIRSPRCAHFVQQKSLRLARLRSPKQEPHLAETTS